MLVAISGTPGTGKTSVSKILEQHGFEVFDLNKLSVEKGFVVGFDKKRGSRIVDVDKLDRYVGGFSKGKNLVFFEGHLSHLLKNMDKVIILRCHPSVLKKRLAEKNWNKEKIKENVEAEVLDIVLCESVENHHRKNIFEIDTTDKTVDQVASCVLEVVENKFKPMKKYNIGYIDWSEEILKEF
ncbi:MAG: adenylate kinase family protein [Candidatus Thermoplasmatota archaeon]|jgi:adenylate kinase|nr:adenylate kinase family protein [Candidatus Thermoplasmatota archaeon]